MLARTCEDDDPNMVIIDRRLESVVQLVEQDPTLRIQDLGPVGRDLEHRAGAFD